MALSLPSPVLGQPVHGCPQEFFQWANYMGSYMIGPKRYSKKTPNTQVVLTFCSYTLMFPNEKTVRRER